MSREYPIASAETWRLRVVELERANAGLRERVTTLAADRTQLEEERDDLEWALEEGARVLDDPERERWFLLYVPVPGAATEEYAGATMALAAKAAREATPAEPGAQGEGS